MNLLIIFELMIHLPGKHCFLALVILHWKLVILVFCC